MNLQWGLQMKQAYLPSINPWQVRQNRSGAWWFSGDRLGSGCKIALMVTGTDTGGSIRQPAAFVALWG